MSWPSLFALLPNCEVECVNINQMVPVTLKQASPLPATHPLPPLSTALTLSSHSSSQPLLPPPLFSNPATPNARFLSWGVTPSSPWQPQAVGFPLGTHCSSPPGSQHHVGMQLLCCQELPTKHRGPGSACSSPGHTLSPAWQLPWDNHCSHHILQGATECPSPWENAQLGFSAKTWRRGQCITCPSHS